MLYYSSFIDENNKLNNISKVKCLDTDASSLAQFCKYYSVPT